MSRSQSKEASNINLLLIIVVITALYMFYYATTQFIKLRKERLHPETKPNKVEHEPSRPSLWLKIVSTASMVIWSILAICATYIFILALNASKRTDLGLGGFLVGAVLTLAPIFFLLCLWGIFASWSLRKKETWAKTFIIITSLIATLLLAKQIIGNISYFGFFNSYILTLLILTACYLFIIFFLIFCKFKE
jgi:hypothetical protein